MQANRQHLRRVQAVRIPFPVQSVERRLQIVEELGAAVESLRGRKAHVIGIERVGDHQMRHARLCRIAGRDLSPVRQVIRVGI